MQQTKAQRTFRAVVKFAVKHGVGLATHTSGDFVLVYPPGTDPHGDPAMGKVYAASTASAARFMIRRVRRQMQQGAEVRQ